MSRRPHRVGMRAARLAVGTAPGLFAGYAALTLVGAVLPVALAWLTKLVLDRISNRSGALDTLLGLVAGLAVTGLLTAVVPGLIRFCGDTASRRVARGALDGLFSAVNRLVGLDRFEDPTFLNRLRMAQQAAGGSPNRIVECGLGTAQSLITVGGLVGSLIAVNPVLSAVLLVAAVPTLLAELALSRRRAGMMWEVAPAERREMFYSLLLISVEAAKEIRLFGAGRFLLDRMIAERRVADAARQRMSRRELFVQAGLELLGAVVIAGGLVWAARQAWLGRLTVGDVSMLIVAAGGAQAALTNLVGQVSMGQEHLLLFDHYLAVVDAVPPAVPAPAVAGPLARLGTGIELRDVWFRYAPDQPWVLQGVSFAIPAGAAIALVGRNGAGKSTLVKLMCRFYEPTRGAIYWDGVDIGDIPPERLRERIGAVFQDYMEYDLTAAENIAIGDVSAIGDTDRIEAAARRAGIHDTLANLPNGYATMLSRIFGDDNDPVTGMALSGGQWQRVAVARALLADDRDLLILDEPSAGLDAEAEHELHARLQAHRSGRTSVLISHRLSAVRDADMIVVLDAGRVVEQGEHDRLLDRSGLYADLFRIQAAGYRTADDRIADHRIADHQIADHQAEAVAG